MTDIFTPDSLDYDNTATVTRHGFTFTLSTEYDSHHGAPWDEEDGHGPVSDWRKHGYNGHASKDPGERPLCSNRFATRFYDMRAAVQTARREQRGSLYPYTLKMKRKRGVWHVSATHYRLETLTAKRRDINRAIGEIYAMRRAQFHTDRAYYANAAEADFQRLRAWCDNDWYYMGVIVTVSRNGIELARDSLWGIESDSDDSYILETANQCAAQALDDARDAIERLAA